MSIISEHLTQCNAFVSVFMDYYKGFYPSEMYNELAKEVYKNFSVDVVKDILDRYNYCFEISELDKTTERIHELLHIFK